MCSARFYHNKSETKLFETALDNHRTELGYQAPVDVPCGLPSTISFVSQNPYEDVLHDGKGIVCCAGDPVPLDNVTGIISSVSHLCRPDVDVVPVRSGHSSSIYSGCSSGSDNGSPGVFNGRYIQINRSQAFKIPRFNKSEILCNMTDIITFHNLEYYEFSYFEGLLSQLQHKINQDNKGGKNNKRDDLGSLTIACSPLGNQIENYTWIDNPSGWERLVRTEITLDEYWANYKKSTSNKTYMDRIAECKQISDTLEKTQKFYWYYTLHRREVPSVNEAIREYLRQGLHTNSDSSSARREKRFEFCRKFIASKFDLTKCGFHLEDWDEQKDVYIDYVSRYLPPDIEMKWYKSSKKSYNLTVEELALVYFAIQKSNQYDQSSRDQVVKYSFSYYMVKMVFKTIYQKGCHRAKTARILTILQQIGLIRKSGNYIAGVRGNCFFAVGVGALPTPKL